MHQDPRRAWARAVLVLGVLLTLLRALSIWLELLPASAIDISVLFLPLALVAMSWPAHVRRRHPSTLRSPT